jgi:hypothetical protein
MPGTFSYAEGAPGTVTVTGGTSVAPATFADFVTADRAGTANSQDTRAITVVDASPVAVTRAIRPVERLVLGGPANTLYLVITNWNATSATIHIAGTDMDGNAASEDIVVTANGTYYTVNRYKTIISTQVTALTGTGFTYTLTQKGWGVIWNKENGQYQIDCLLIIGDGSTSTYLTDITKSIVFSSLTGTAYIQVKTNATFTLGQILDSILKTTHNGCYVYIPGGTTYAIWGRGGITNFLGCLFSGSGNVTALLGQMYDCTMDIISLYAISNGLDINNLIIKNTATALYNISTQLNDINIESITLRNIYLAGSPNYTMSNVISKNTSPPSQSICANVFSGNAYLINCNIEWIIYWLGTSPGIINRQYTFDLLVTDINGTPISGATVTLKDKTGATVFSLTTAADGTITEQTVTRGYYNQANGSTLQDNGPHTLTIIKSGYQNYQDVITIGQAMDLEVAMLAPAAGGGAGVAPTNLGLVPLGVKQVAI